MAATGSTQKRGKTRNGNGASGPVIALPHGRVPPHNLDAEKSLLGGILLDPVLLRELADICSASDFYRDAHRKVFEAMLSLLEDGIGVDRVSVTERLQGRGDLEAVGGAEYLELLDNSPPISANLAYYAKIIHDKARARRLIETASVIAQLGYEQHGDIAEYIAEARKRFKAVVEDGSASAAALVSPIPLTAELLRSPPPAREYMLVDDKGKGVYIQGRVGLFGAPGGTGKTWSLAGLAVAVATGRPWFGDGGFYPPSAGRVLLVMAEDDDEEVLRVLFHTAIAMGVETDEDLALLSRNVTAKGFAGHGVSLTLRDDGRASALPETAFAIGMRNYLRAQAAAQRPFRLVILDPLSRFAGVDTEKDAAAATRWVQVVESLTAAENGRPSVVVSCHTRKPSENEDRKSTDFIRGSSALRDAVRWAAVIEQKKRKADAADLLSLSIGKANGVPPRFSPLFLCRDRAHEGALRVATPQEIASHQEEKAEDEDSMTIDQYEDRILELMRPGDAYQKTELVETAKGNRKMLYAAIAALVRKKELVEVGRGQTLRVMLNQQADLALQVPASSAQVPAGGKGTGSPSSRSVSPPKQYRGGNRRNLAVPGGLKNAVEPSKGVPSSAGSEIPGTDEPPPHTDEDAPRLTP